MGRHAADRPAPDSTATSARRPVSDPGVPGRKPAHADLFTPTPGRNARRNEEARAAAAFDLMIRPHRDGLREYVSRLTGGDESITDTVVKETLYRAGQDPSRYPQRTSAVRPWLVLIARTVLSDGERLAPAGHDDRPSPWSPEERSPSPLGAPPTTVIGAMEELAATHRDILVELFYRGVSLEEAAQSRGVPVETVKAGLYFAMRSLRAVLDQQVADRHT